MSNLQFLTSIDVPLEHLVKICTDYEKIPNYLPGQIKSIKIIETKDKQVTTEDKIVFSSLIKNMIEQQSTHQQVSADGTGKKIGAGFARRGEIFPARDNRG